MPQPSDWYSFLGIAPVAAGAFSFLLNQIRDADRKIRENTDGNWLIKSKDGRRISGFEMVNGGTLAGRINDPVFPDTGSHIEV